MWRNVRKILNLQNALFGLQIIMEHICTAEIPVNDYLARFRNVAKFLPFCQQCKNYGNSWACPPFQFDADARIGQWRNALLVAVRFELSAGDKSLSDAMPLLRPVRQKFEALLLELERQYGGLAFGFSGECLHCSRCARARGEACVHPDRVRPALEAYGFDITLTIKELFGFELEWAKEGLLPDRLTLVGGFFHNEEPGKIKFAR